MRNLKALSSISSKISQMHKFPSVKKTQFNKKKINLKSPKLSKPEISDHQMISASSSSGSNASDYIIELEEPFEKSVSSMFDFSIGLNSLAEVLDKILFYLYAAAICDHSYKSLQHLLNSSLKCAPDVQYLVISIAILVLKEGVPPKKKYWTEFSKVSRTLSQTRQTFVSFGKKQNVARRNLINFSGIFSDHQNRVSLDEDIDHDHYGIDIIIDYVLSQGKGKRMYKQWKFPDPSPNSIKRYYRNNDENDSQQINKCDSQQSNENCSYQTNISIIPQNNNTNDQQSNVSDIQQCNKNSCDLQQCNNIGHGSPIKSKESNRFNYSFLDCCSYISNSDDIYITSVSASSEGEEENENEGKDENENENERNDEPPKQIRKFSITNQKEFELKPVNDLTKAVANLFSDWSTAYTATKKVWELLKIESEFDLDSLYRILPFSYADFLKSALKTYEEVGDPI
ncbi:hypothetical protein M9Y10_017805 [Tritrichomonas musculus]|uniref:Cyclin N-terminal domain-containing protein n=1 Tax=Tritrichomonas musculus TaxID=1915356 RepID=A0ABR2GMD4_9EUKA